VTVTKVGVVTAFVVIGTTAVTSPAGNVNLAGTVSAVLLELHMKLRPEGAPPLRNSAANVLLPPTILLAAGKTSTRTGGTTVSLAVAV
jgi:hypothetical protein